jgi:integrase
MEGFCLSETKRDRPVLFSEIVDDYVQFQNAHNRPPHNDCVRILFWKDRWRDCPVAAISRQDVEQGKLALSERRDPQRTPKRHPNKRTYRPAIINRYLAALQGCLNLAIRNGKATTNPVVGTRFLRENNGRLKYLPSPEAELALLDAVPDARRREMVELAVHTGLRWSEQMGLRWRDCDFLAGTLAVSRSKHGGARHIPMNSRARDILMDMATRRLPQGTEHVFRSAMAKSRLRRRIGGSRAPWPRPATCSPRQDARLTRRCWTASRGTASATPSLPAWQWPAWTS